MSADPAERGEDPAVERSAGTSDEDGAAGGTLADRLDPVRRGRLAEPALVVATAVGLAATVLHWSGLVLAGVLLGLTSTSPRRALAQGLTFGLVVVVAFGLWLLASGDLATWTGTGPLFGLAVGAPFVLPALAALGSRALT